ncbi:hypothetical protein SAMN04488109_0886 [Chryseolinea serpens]|uniref:Uncharacterized protein n=1 Tax=Chryseolinea serpens TaxID=947013 RepID=A0A1M5KXJ6_9BACT|nr:hypothetical protein SAMN04488109_0886 [Chryseolinea serpens]
MVAPPTTKATNINLLNFKTVPLRTFHTPVLCFFGWFWLAGFLFASATVAFRESLFMTGIAVTMLSFVSLAFSLSKNAQLVLVLNPKTRICTGRRYGLTYNLRYNTVNPEIN